MPGRYEGFVSARLEVGSLDVGAFAFPTDAGQAVGYRWRHHTADWSFADALLRHLQDAGAPEPRHVKQTLYVHN